MIKRNCTLVCENFLEQINNLTPDESGQQFNNLAIQQSFNLSINKNEFIKYKYQKASISNGYVNYHCNFWCHWL
jgi:hypothetical protein